MSGPAFILTQSVYEDIGDLAEQFTVRLSPDGSEPQTHWGMNWVNIPDDVCATLCGRDGVTTGEDFWTLTATMGLQVVVSDA